MKKTQESIISFVEEKMSSRPKIVRMFKNCYQNTLETTIRKNEEDGTVFMLTGDIPAMWLRDSTNQIRPYLLVARENEDLQNTIEGLMKKQFLCIELDPYANAFNEGPNGMGHQTDDTDMKPEIWERKYEIDSLCYPVQLAYLYWKNTEKTLHFDELFRRTMHTIIDLWNVEQYHSEKSDYFFRRENCTVTDTLPFEGKGNPVDYTGMTWSGFRPSDDTCIYGYLVPSNMFAAVVLGYMLEINEKFYQDGELAAKAAKLKKEIEEGIEKFALVEKEGFGRVYAFEVDGRGNRLFMDDANVPSLLSMPYFYFCSKTDPHYQNTRKLILSPENPFYYAGKAAHGIGSPHTPEDYIWHIALSIQGMTAADAEEKERILDYFERTDADTDLVHEGFHKDDPYQFTREWFSWSNAMFVEFVLSVCGLEIEH